MRTFIDIVYTQIYKCFECVEIWTQEPLQEYKNLRVYLARRVLVEIRTQTNPRRRGMCLNYDTAVVAGLKPSQFIH